MTKIKLRNLLADGKTNEVLTELRSLSAYDSDLHNEVLQISAQFAENDRQRRLDIADPRDVRTEQNRINFVIIMIIDRLSDVAIEQLNSRTQMVIELAYNSYLLGFILNSNIDSDDHQNYKKVIKAYEDDILNSLESLNLKRDTSKSEHENFMNYKKNLNSKEDTEILEFGLNVAILQTLIYSMPHLKGDYKQRGYETYNSIYNKINNFFVIKQKAELTRFIPNIDSKEGDCHKIIQEYILSIK